MTAAHDRKSVDVFDVVLGVLLGAAAGILVALASVLAGGPPAAPAAEDNGYRRAVVQRIAPLGQVAIAGRPNPAPPTMPPAAVATPPPAAAAVLSGEQTYRGACLACHGAGLAGAPKLGDRAVWAPRIGQGLAVLRAHALHGFQGKTGVMPAKGGRIDLADQSVLNGVEYMVNAAK